MESVVEYHINTKATKMLRSGQKSIQQDSNRGDHMKHGLSKTINLFKKGLRVVSLVSLGTKCQLKPLGLGVHTGLFPGIEVTTRCVILRNLDLPSK